MEQPPRPDEGAPGNDFPGLTSAEAAALAARGQDNRMPKVREGGVGSILRRNTLTLFTLLNLTLAALLFMVGSYRNMLFMGVVVSNALIGTLQELRAKRMHDRLALLSEDEVRTLRDGGETLVAFHRLVQGDVTLLSRGDQVPADAEIIRGACEADESLLTGESESIVKRQGDTLLSGSFLTGGAVAARLVAVGADSYAGKLQAAARRVKRSRSELMDNMKKIIRYVSMAILPMGLLLFWRQMANHELGVQAAVTKTVAAVLGMIPEGLILLTSLALTMGVIRLGRRKAMVNALYGIESLARTDVVCMDKTGTLTSGDMTLAKTVPLSDMPEDELGACVRAILSAQEDQNATKDALSKAFPPDGHPVGHPDGLLMERVPFSSERKWSAARFDDAALQTLVLGAPERVLADFPPELERAREMAGQGLRALALLKSPGPLNGEELPEGLRPLALFCLREALRPDVRETIRYFEEQGVSLKIISGDHPLTAKSIAEAAGVPLATQCFDLSALESPVDYGEICEAYTVFGRASPEDKQGLIAALQGHGHSVAMVGDGVNDIPALKAADCSIAMAGGHNAACRVAQITLLDQNFAVMPEIVAEGRRAIGNITRAASLFLVKNLFSFLLAASLLVLPFVYPFAPIQLTLVSSLTIGLPSFVLAFQPGGERVRGHFLRNVLLRALPGGIAVWAVTLLICALGAPLSMSGAVVSTLCTVAAGYAGLWTLLLTSLPLNALRGGLVIAMAALLAGAMWVFAPVFYFVPIEGVHRWVLAGLMAFIPLCLWGVAWIEKSWTGKEDKAPYFVSS